MGGDATEPTDARSLYGADDNEQRRQRAMYRQIFRAMAVEQVQERPLTWWRRRKLVRFARCLGIAPFEARLILRAVEYACGHVRPAAADRRTSPVHGAYLAEAEPHVVRPWVGVVVLMWVLACLLLLIAGR